MNRRPSLLLALCLMLTLSQTACMHMVHVERIAEAGEISEGFFQGTDRALADHFFNIGVLDKIPEDLTTAVDWNWYEELYYRSLPGHSMKERLKWSQELDFAQVIAQVIHAVDQEEFVYTYEEELSMPDRFLASAEVLGFGTAREYGSAPTLRSVLSILLKARADLGYYTPYLGHIEDINIYQLAREKYNSIDRSFFLEEAPKLFALGVKCLEGISGGAFTGFNVKSCNEDPLFSKDRTVRYDHGDIGHLLQMISLLRRERINARIAVKSRIASYVHHADKWGEPDWASLTAEIDEHRAVVSSDAFDILFEFGTRAELEAFKGIVDEYALRKEEDPCGLIRDSYYAPLYACYMPLPGYEEVIDLRVSMKNKGFYLQSYVLADYFPDVLEAVTEYAADFPDEFTIGYSTCYVNPEFIDYLWNNLTEQQAISN